MILLSSDIGAFIWRGTVHPRGGTAPRGPPWRRPWLAEQASGHTDTEQLAVSTTRVFYSKLVYQSINRLVYHQTA